MTDERKTQSTEARCPMQDDVCADCGYRCVETVPPEAMETLRRLLRNPPAPTQGMRNLMAGRDIKDNG